MFPNPVAGIILPRGAAQSWPQFVVTQTAVEHADRPPLAIDIGNGRAGSPVWAMASGRVIEVRPTLDGVLTIETPDHWRIVYAHMTGIVASLGQEVTAGEGIGYVGAVSPTPIYAHLHLQIAQRRWLVWTWLDPWPLLNQNTPGGSDMTITITRYPSPRSWSTRGGVLTGYRTGAVSVTNTGTFGPGSPAQASAEYAIEPTPAGWPAGPYQLILNGALANYLVANSQIDLGPVPVPAPVGGITQAQLDAAVGVAEQGVRAAWLDWLETHPR